MKALILAAGYGTRMYPLTKYWPKSLLEIEKNKPVINYLIEKIEKIKEIDQILVITNERFFSVFQNWSKKINTSKTIKILNDGTKKPKERLGAIGDIIFVIKNQNLKDDLLVIGGDNLFEENLNNFINFCFKKRPRPCIGIHDIKKRELAKRYGTVKLDNKNKILDFYEKKNNPSSTEVAMCLYFFPKEKINLFGEYSKVNKNKIDLAGLYINWLCEKEDVFGFEFKGNWFDIGHEDSYKKAQLNFNKRRVDYAKV